MNVYEFELVELPTYRVLTFRMEAETALEAVERLNALRNDSDDKVTELDIVDVKYGPREKSELEELREKIEYYRLLLIRKNEALGVFADKNLWDQFRGTYCWQGTEEYSNPMEFAQRELENNKICDRM